MPSADVDVTRSLYRAIESGDGSAWDEVLDPDVEWVIPPSLPWGGTRRGVKQVKQFAQEMRRHLHNSRVETDEFIDVGDGELIVLGRYRGEATLTGAAIEAEFAHHVRVSDGRVVRFQNYIDSGTILQGIAEPPAD